MQAEDLGYILSIPLWSDFIRKRTWTDSLLRGDFQSHYGLILSMTTTAPCVLNFCLSIPLWSDFIPEREIPLFLTSVFLSIPLWSDFIDDNITFSFYVRYTFNPTMVWFYQANRAVQALLVKRLSIPLWSDFICILSKMDNTSYLTFNPTMVWFYQMTWKRWEYERTFAFNPTMVWFYPERYPNKREIELSLSIPLWSDFIKNCRGNQSTHNVNLSIPLWSDFIVVATLDDGTTVTLFQSHYGLILSSF